MRATDIVAGDAERASAIIPAQMGELFTKARADALTRASGEILALAQAAMGARVPGSPVDDPDMLVTAVLRRVELLASCIGVLTDPRCDDEETAAQYQLVFGRVLRLHHE